MPLGGHIHKVGTSATHAQRLIILRREAGRAPVRHAEDRLRVETCHMRTNRDVYRIMQSRCRGSVADRVQPRLACQLHTNRFLLSTLRLGSRSMPFGHALLVIKLLIMAQACNIDLCVGGGWQSRPDPETNTMHPASTPYPTITTVDKSNQCSPPNNAS